MTSTAVCAQFCVPGKIITRKGACVYVLTHKHLCVCVSCMRKTIKVHWDIKQIGLRALDNWLHRCKLRHTLGYKTLSCESGIIVMINSINTFLPTHAWFWNKTFLVLIKTTCIYSVLPHRSDCQMRSLRMQEEIERMSMSAAVLKQEQCWSVKAPCLGSSQNLNVLY